MIIRPAEPDELPELVVMAMATFSERFPMEAAPEQILQTFRMILFGGGYLRVAEVDEAIAGYLAGVVSPIRPWSAERCAIELLLMVKPDHRKSRAAVMLMHDFEAWAQDAGCSAISMTAHAVADGERVGRFYERQGFRPMETIYLKRIA